LTEFEEWEEGKYFAYSSDDVRINVLNTEPDGTEFCFKGVILDMTFSAASSSRNLMFELRENIGTNSAGKLLDTNVANAIQTSNRWYQACFESLNGGVWTGIQNANYTITPVISRQIPRFEPMRAIRLSNTLLPAGSTIIIYGVRA
jgi:hypothetical protein